MKRMSILSLAVSSVVALSIVSTAATAAAKKAEPKKEPNIFELIDADLKSFDKAVFGPQKTSSKVEKKSKKQ